MYRTTLFATLVLLLAASAASSCTAPIGEVDRRIASTRTPLRPAELPDQAFVEASNTARPVPVQYCAAHTSHPLEMAPEPFLYKPFSASFTGQDWSSQMDHSAPTYMPDGTLSALGETISSTDSAPGVAGGTLAYDISGAREWSGRDVSVTSLLAEGFRILAYQSPSLEQYLYYDGHDGHDFAVTGSALAAADGTVIFQGTYDNGLGLVVELWHPEGYLTRYAHLASLEKGLEIGTKVSAGDPIGVIGGSAALGGELVQNYWGVHLHFSVFRWSANEGMWLITDPFGWDPWAGVTPGEATRAQGSDPLQNCNGEISYNLWVDRWPRDVVKNGTKPFHPSQDFYAGGFLRPSTEDYSAPDITRFAGPFLGSWSNLDPDTRGVTRITISDSYEPRVWSTGFVSPAFVNEWGACEPEDCKWGDGDSCLNEFRYSFEDASGNQPDDSDQEYSLSLRWVFCFATTDQVLTLEPDGSLKVIESTHFTDLSGRQDYGATYYFYRTSGGPETEAGTNRSDKDLLAGTWTGTFSRSSKTADGQVVFTGEFDYLVIEDPGNDQPLRMTAHIAGTDYEEEATFEYTDDEGYFCFSFYAGDGTLWRRYCFRPLDANTLDYRGTGIDGEDTGRLNRAGASALAPCPAKINLQDPQSLIRWTICAVARQDAHSVAQSVGPMGASFGAPFGTEIDSPGQNNSIDVERELQRSLDMSSTQCLGYRTENETYAGKIYVFFSDLVLIGDPESSADLPTQFIFFKLGDGDDYNLVAIGAVADYAVPELKGLTPCPAIDT